MIDLSTATDDEVRATAAARLHAVAAAMPADWQQQHLPTCLARLLQGPPDPAAVDVARVLLGLQPAALTSRQDTAS